MKTLTVNELAPFLPYGLMTNQGELVSLDSEFLTCGLKVKYNPRDISDLIPEVRPLSQLIEEIEHNGVKIIPILELAKIYESDQILSFETNAKYNVFGIKYDDSADLTTVFAYHGGSKTFGCHTTLGVVFHTVTNQLDLFCKLFEWHFDVFGWIEGGLATEKK